MTSLFKRVLKVFAPGSTPTQPPAAPAAVPAQADKARPVAAAAPARPAVPVLAVRRPLMAASGEVAGFEFRIDDKALQLPARSNDAAVQAAHVAVLLVSARLVALGGRTGFARMPASWLVHAVVPKNESGTVIGIDFDPAETLTPQVHQALVDAVAQFRAVGAKLAWDPAFDLGSAPDFVLLRPAADQSAAALLDALKARPAAQQSIPAIVTDLVNLEDLELALQAGVRFVSGKLASRTATQKPAHPLSPEVGRVAHLLSQLSAGADTAAIVGAIKGDVSVSVTLLQRMNSASFAHLGGISSIDQAVLMLGRSDLHRWLSLMLTQFAGKRKLSTALQEVALWRSRLLELLAIERGEPEPGRFFTLGLASMLGLILKLTPAEVAATLSLPPEAAQALLEQTGPWYPYLHMATQLESQTITDASATADGFASAERVLELSSDAWTWAADNMVRDGTGKSASATVAPAA